MLLAAITLSTWLYAAPPAIGNLVMPPPYWEAVCAAAWFYDLDPDWIAAVMAIESRYDPRAVNKRCRAYGLMQIQIDVARAYGLADPFDGPKNIWVGAAILAKLARKCGGNKRRILQRYNPEDDGRYFREVCRAYRQAKARRFN